MVGGISFGGLGSGLDTGAIIDALLKLESQPIKILEGRKALEQKKIDLLGTLKGHIDALRDKARDMGTLAGFLLPGLVAGSVIVETVFAIPGLGRLFVDAAFQRDVPVLMGLTLLSGAATLAGILLADLAYAVVDPRIRRA